MHGSLVKGYGSPLRFLIQRFEETISLIESIDLSKDGKANRAKPDLSRHNLKLDRGWENGTSLRPCLFYNSQTAGKLLFWPIKSYQVQEFKQVDMKFV